MDTDARVTEAVATPAVEASGQLDAAAQARQRVAAVRDDPRERLRMRVAFYDRYGFKVLPPGYGASELAFLRWEIERGVLNPASHPQPGSAWWRAVNEGLLVAAEEASLLYQYGGGAPSSQSAARWLEYLRAPSEVTWYRAHNTSIVRGYVEHTDLARAECVDEQRFLNMVLYRVIFAQAMVEARAPRKDVTLRLWDEIEHLIANPELPAVEVLVSIADFYPRSYPATALDDAGGADVAGQLVTKLFDDELILRHVDRTYASVATALEMPELRMFLRDNKPAYPPVLVA